MPKSASSSKGTSTNSRPTIDFNLDELDREDAVEPFTFRLGNRNYTCVDIRDLDFRILEGAQAAFTRDDVYPAIELILEPDDRAEFATNRLSIRKLQALFTAYNAHYGIDSSALAPGQ